MVRLQQLFPVQNSVQSLIFELHKEIVFTYHRKDVGGKKWRQLNRLLQSAVPACILSVLSKLLSLIIQKLDL